MMEATTVNAAPSDRFHLPRYNWRRQSDEHPFITAHELGDRKLSKGRDEDKKKPAFKPRFVKRETTRRSV